MKTNAFPSVLPLIALAVGALALILALGFVG